MQETTPRPAKPCSVSRILQYKPSRVVRIGERIKPLNPSQATCMESTGQPQSVVTLLWCDVVSSREGWSRHGSDYSKSLRLLEELGREVCAGANGKWINGTGDGWILSFNDPISAVRGALYAQERTIVGPWPETVPRLLLRMGMHTGIVPADDPSLACPTTWDASRIIRAAHGGQILLSEATASFLHTGCPTHDAPEIRPLGRFRLPGLPDSIELFLVAAPWLPEELPPPRAFKLEPLVLASDRPFIGREHEIATIIGLFRGKGARAVTLTGIGGIGKTRLSIELMGRLSEDFPDGVRFVELDGKSGEGDLLAAVGVAFGIDQTVVADRAFQLENALATTRSLVVLDCFERMIDCRKAIDRLIRVSRFASFLVTSRRSLGIPQEYVVELPPMKTARSGRSGSEAVDLFEEAAGHVDPAFHITAKNRTAVHSLCEALDGIPLAIIMAASRLRYLSLDEILAQSERSRLRVASDRSPLLDRHSSMERVVQDSFDLLPSLSRALLAKLSIFRGGFYREEAAEVTQTEPDDLVDALALLQENSLLVHLSHPQRSRYRLLDTVREFVGGVASNELAEDVLAACRARHSQCFAALSRHLHALSLEGQWRTAMERLMIEIGNFREATAYAIESRDENLIADFAQSLARVYFEAGLFADFQKLAAAAEGCTSHPQSRAIQMMLLGLRGALALREKQTDVGTAFWQERLQIAQSCGDTDVAVDTLIDLAELDYEAGNLESARAQIDRALAPHMHAGDAATLSATALRARIACAAKESDHALRLCSDIERAIRPHHSPDAVIFARLAAAESLSALGADTQALDAFRLSAKTAREGQRLFGIARALVGMARIHLRTSEPEIAVRELVAAKRLCEPSRTGAYQAACILLDRAVENGPSPIESILSEASVQEVEELLDVVLFECRAAIPL
jgi:predicted ATPase/class 3 adenylate cyclase